MIELRITSDMTKTSAKNPFYRFSLRYRNRLLPEIDNYNRNLAARLTKHARDKLKEGARRPQERGSRPKKRLTGRLGPAITGSARNAGAGSGSGGSRVGRGVQWPNVNNLNRRARHWRTVEFGREGVRLPKGVWIPGSGGDVFYTYLDFLKSQRLSTSRLIGRRSRGARGRAVASALAAGGKFQTETVASIEGRFFLTETWNEVVGPNGEHVENDYRKIIRDAMNADQG